MGSLGALLRPTWQSYAGLPPEEGAFCRLAAAALPLAAKTKQPGFARWKCTPSAYGTSPRESMSLDSQVALLPYESSSLATPQAVELWALNNALYDSVGKHRAAYSAL